MINASKIFATFALLMLGIVFLSFPLAEAQNSDTPAIVSSTAPIIPSHVIATRARGNVVVELSIDTKGRIISAKAVEGHPILRKPTEQAAAQWRFAPSNDKARTLRLTFIYPMMDYGERTSITILPYRINLKVELPKRPRPPETVSYIPSEWRTGDDRCKVHSEILRKDKVEIIYGLIGFREGYLEAEEKLFPNANEVAFGGCVIETDENNKQISPKYAEVLYCRKCREAARKWSKENKNRKFNA